MESAGQDINLNSPSKGLIMGTSLSDSPAGAAGVATPCALSGLSQEEHEELTLELSKVEEEIHTLRQVLAAKEKHAGDLKRRLGLTPLEELKQNLTRSWHDVQASSAYKKTQETLTQASQRTSAALSTVGTVISRKFGDMRNSPTFRSFEDKVGSMKYKVVGGVSDEGLRSPSEQSHP
ncbi:tumor protein D54 isoform X4 [Scleropages formosus]|uniref:tumor protein D54 isoform X4 n=1 Tax=Scleropages formosus TaxID=113540 RepID=UPI000878BB9E|nr:tumor protein D54 isoform X4 [Scleropages formosus]